MNVIHTMNGNNSVSMFSDPASVAAAESAKARIQSAYIVALQKPRNYDNARLKILDACKRPDFAEKAEYTKPVGGTTITGPSIRLAELALREWGNIMYENQVIFDDEAVRRIRVTVIDLESNATFSKEIQLSKTVERRSKKGREQDVISERLNSYGSTVYLLKATDDEVQTREAALVSKALRNEGLRLIPSEIIDECLLTARKTMQSRDRKDPDEARKKLTEAFFAYGVQPTELEKYLGHPLAQCQPDELHELRSIYRAIKDGEAKWASFMERKETERTEKEQPKTSDMMTQLMNASGEDKKTPAQAPAPTPEAQEVEWPRKQEPIEAEAEPQQSQNEPLTLTQTGTLPFDAAPAAAKPAPQASQRSGLTSYEVLREEAQALMGPSGLNLNAEGKGKYLARITGKSTVKELTMADLRAVINDAQARLEKMGAQRNDV